MLQKLLLFTFALTLSACSSGKAAKGSGNGLDPNPPLPGFAGEFVDAKEDSQAYNKINTCVNPQQVNWDARLQKGQEFVFNDKWSAVGGGYMGRGDLRREIESVDRATGTLVQKDYLTGPGGQVAWVRQKCVYQGSGKGVRCDAIEMSPNLATLMKGQNGDGAVTKKQCWLKWDGQSKTTTLTESGNYKFKKVGRKFSAVRQTETKFGNLTCDDQPAGKGTIETVRIFSSEVPTLDYPTCGLPGRIYEYQIAKNEKGGILAISKFELIDGRF